jgi:hypothetical protein
MADVQLRVPLVGQQSGYDGRPLMRPNAAGRMAPHGHMACWYASACMVSYYFRLGPRIGLPPVWEADQGLTVRAIDELARAEGLQALAKTGSRRYARFHCRCIIDQRSDLGRDPSRPIRARDCFDGN